MTSYFPYPLQDLANLGWVSQVVPTRLGRLRLYRQPGDPVVDTLFLHGVDLESTAWSPLVQAAAGDTTGWALLDLPGFGGSDPLTHPLTLDEASEAVVDVLDGLGVASAHVVGHSMGGFLALHLAGVAPQRVRSLVSVNGAYSTIVDVVNAPARTLLRAPRATIPYLTISLVAHLGRVGTVLLRVGAATGLLRLGLLGLAAHPLRVPRRMLEVLARGHRPQAFLYAEQTGEGYDCGAVWAGIQVPVLGVFGAADVLVSERDRAVLARALPAAGTTVMPEAGHLLPMEQPDSLLAALRAVWVAY